LRTAAGPKEDIFSKKGNEDKELTQMGACNPRGGAISSCRAMNIN